MWSACYCSTTWPKIGFFPTDFAELSSIKFQGRPSSHSRVLMWENTGWNYEDDSHSYATLGSEGFYKRGLKSHVPCAIRHHNCRAMCARMRAWRADDLQALCHAMTWSRLRHSTVFSCFLPLSLQLMYLLDPMTQMVLVYTKNKLCFSFTPWNKNCGGPLRLNDWQSRFTYGCD
jgi:hypothetical protein